MGALWRALSVALPGALAIGLALAAWPHVRDAAARHPYFAVREVVVRDHHRLPADEIRAAAGIAPGTSIWEMRPPRRRASPGTGGSARRACTASCRIGS